MGYLDFLRPVQGQKVSDPPELDVARGRYFSGHQLPVDGLGKLLLKQGGKLLTQEGASY